MKLLFFACTMLISTCTFSQKSGQTDWEIGGSVGWSWYNGDLNSTKIFGQDYMHKMYGLNLRRNLNQRWALRFEGNYGELSADDALSENTFQLQRNLNFKSKLYEGAGMIEFNFLEFDALIPKYRFSPYTFIGLGVFRFDPETTIEGNVYKLHSLQTEGKSYSRTNVSIPFGLGFKLALSDRILVSTDWGMRKTFSDYIDDVSDMYPKAGDLTGLAENLSDRSLQQSGPDGSNWGTQRGNARSKDWYSIVKITLAIRIGPKKGSCKHLRI
jgi:hypothetical protein